MAERGIHVDHSTLNRWVVRLAPQLEKVFQSRKRSLGLSWRMDETYIKVRGTWKYLYPAVDKAGQTVDFLLAARRAVNAAFRFFCKAIGDQTEPVQINIDKSGSNTSAIDTYNYENRTYIEIRQNKYLNNLVEQDHRFIKKIVNPTLGFKSFASAAATIKGTELMHMIRKNQATSRYSKNKSYAEQFYSLAA